MVGVFKTLAFVGGGLTIVFILSNLKRASQEITTAVRGGVQGLTVDGLKLWLEFNIKNPTKTRLHLSPPMIKLYYEGKEILSSLVKLNELPESVLDRGKILVGPYRETGPIKILPEISKMYLLTSGYSLFSKLSDQQAVELEVVVVADIYINNLTIPYKSRERFTII